MMAKGWGEELRLQHMTPSQTDAHIAGRADGRITQRIASRNLTDGSPGGGPNLGQDTLDILPDYRQSRQHVTSPDIDSQRPYITRRFIDYIKPSLTDRDLIVIATVARFGLMTTSHLAHLFFSASPTTATNSPSASRIRTRQAQKVLQRLAAQRLIGRLERRVGGARAGSAGYIYGLGPAGHRLLGLPGEARRIREPLSPHIDHTLCVSDLYVQLMIAQRHRVLTVLDHKTEPECWEKAMGEWLKPDAYVRVETPYGQRCRWYIELDRGGPRGAQSERRIQAKLDQYVLFWRRQLLPAPVFPRIIFVAMNAQRVAQLQDIIAKQPPIVQQLFVAVAFTETVDFMARAGAAEAAVIDPLRALRRSLSNC